MRVSVFLYSLGLGGTERVAAVLANHWAAIGWQVSVLTIGRGHDDHYRLEPEVNHVALDVASDSAGVVRGVLSNTSRLRALRRAIASTEADVTVAMSSTCNVLLALAASGRQGTIRVGSERAYPPKMPIPRHWQWLRRVTYGRLDAVVAQTEVTAAWLRANTTARDVRVIPNPVAWPIPTMDPVRLPASVGRRGRKRVLSVGRLSVEKGYDLLINAFADIVPRLPEWELVIVGDGPEREGLHALIERRGLVDTVLLPGAAGNVGDWYSSADLYVLSSHFEGFPNALLEAMAHGLPAIAVDCDAGPRDIVRNDVDGLLIDPMSPSALREALQRLTLDPLHRARLAARAPEVRGRFSLQHVHGLWCQLFGDLAE